MRFNQPLVSFLLSATLALTLTGCSASFDPADSGPVTLPGVAISGTSFGGRQPIAQAHIYVMRANVSAYAGPGIAPVAGNLANSLLTAGDGSDSVGEYVLTDANGKFSLGSNYTCNAGDQIYLLSLGGKPDGANTNTAVGLMAVLGTCGTSFNSSTTVNMNEVSTIAAAYAMAGFASDATHVGTSGSALALTGIKNAFANANQLYDITSSPYNSPNTVARTSTPNEANGGTGTVPQNQIDMLADILAMCVNTTSSGSSQCTTLFTNGKSTLGASAANTATEAIFMAQNPSNTSVFNLVGSQPFATTITSAPGDLTIRLAFTGGGLGQGAGEGQGITVDASGNLWIVQDWTTQASMTNSTVLSAFNHLGVPNNSSGYAIGLDAPNAAAIDLTSSNLWIANFFGDSVTEFSLTSLTKTATYPQYAGSSPGGLAVDSAGYVWVALNDVNGTSGSVLKLDPSTGTAVNTLSGSHFVNPLTPAFSPGTLGDVWITDAGKTMNLYTNSGSYVNESVVGQCYNVVIDNSGNAWYSSEGTGVGEIAPGNSGTYSHYYQFTGASGSQDTSGIALDGAGNLWAASNAFNSGVVADNSIFEISSAGANLSGSHGYVPATTDIQPNAIAIDGSGNVWYDNGTNDTLYELIGAAVPVATPLSYATANSKLGARP